MALPPHPDATSPARRLAGRSLGSLIIETIRQAEAEIPRDPIIGRLPADQELGRLLGLALIFAEERGERPSALSLIEGVGIAYGEWMRGENDLSVAVTLECFEAGLIKGRAGRKAPAY
jgi:hypothetical protein